MVFMQVLEGWGGDGSPRTMLCGVLGCWLPSVPMTLAWRLQAGGRQDASVCQSWDGFSLDAARSQPSLTSSSPSCSPSGTGARHPHRHQDERVPWDAALFGGTAASPSLPSLPVAGSGATCTGAHGGGAMPPSKGAPDASPPLRCAGPILHRDQQGGGPALGWGSSPTTGSPSRVSGSTPSLRSPLQDSAPMLFFPNLA